MSTWKSSLVQSLSRNIDIFSEEPSVIAERIIAVADAIIEKYEQSIIIDQNNDCGADISKPYKWEKGKKVLKKYWHDTGRKEDYGM